MPAIYQQRPLETWWAYHVLGPEHVMENLGGWGSSKLSVGPHYFHDTNSRHAGPLAKGFHENRDAVAVVSEIGVALSVQDEKLRRLVVAHSALTLRVGSSPMGGSPSVPFCVLLSGAPLASIRLAEPLAEYPELPVGSWRMQCSVHVPPRQNVDLCWTTSGVVLEALRRNELTHELRIVVAAVIRGYERIPSEVRGA